jgi:hypothetical protein
MLLLMMQAFVQKLAVCLLDVDRNPDSPMFEQLNNWTAEATCFVSLWQLFCIAVIFFAFAQSHFQPMAIGIGPAKAKFNGVSSWYMSSHTSWCMSSQDLRFAQAVVLAYAL